MPIVFNRAGSKFIAVLILLISWSAYAQHPPPELVREGAKVFEEAIDPAGKAAGDFRKVAKDWEEYRAQCKVRVLASAPRNYILEGADTSTAKGFHDLVDASLDPISKIVKQAGPAASAQQIFDALQTTNQKRWFWARQQLTLKGDALQVKPAIAESGDMAASIRGLRNFYTQAIREIDIAAASRALH